VHAGLVALLAIVSVLLSAALFALPLSASLVASLLLGAIGLTVVGTLASGLAAQARAREALLPILLVPVAAPLLQAGLAGTMGALAGAPAAELRAPLLLAAGYDVAAIGIAWLLWPAVLEAE
jgi:ABC-type transport system involved in cytochrome c biogenesis permease component